MKMMDETGGKKKKKKGKKNRESERNRLIFRTRVIRRHSRELEATRFLRRETFHDALQHPLAPL